MSRIVNPPEERPLYRGLSLFRWSPQRRGLAQADRFQSAGAGLRLFLFVPCLLTMKCESKVSATLQEVG